MDDSPGTGEVESGPSGGSPALDAPALQTVFQAVDDAILVHDPDGDITAVNDAATDVFGRSRETLRDANLGDLAPATAAGRSELLCTLRRVADRDGDAVEFRAVTGDGEGVWVEGSTSRATVDGRERLVSVFRTVEKSKRYERRLEEERERYGTLVEQSHDGIAVVQDGVYAFVNEAMAELTGRPVDELEGLPFERVIDPEYHDLVRERYRRRIRGESPPNNYEVVVCSAGGERRHVELSVSAIQYDGEPATLALFHDVTERVRREQDLEELTTRLELALEETNTGVWEWNLATDEVVWDETSECLFGFEPGAFPGRYGAFADRVHPEDLPAVERHVERAVETGDVYRAEFRVHLPDGETRWLQARGVLHDEGGDRMVGVQTDITERKRTERELKRRNERLELLNRIVRHDIRNDMEVVNSCVALLREAVDAGNDRAHERLDELECAGEHVVELTELLRDLTRTTQGGDAVEPVPLGPALADEVDAVRSTEDVTVEPPAEYPSIRVLADDMLGTVFRNVLTNAVRHNDRDEPTVDVSVEVGDERVVVRVADDGPGIAEERHEEVFARGEKGLESPGTGLGLHLVDELVADYGGEVWVEDNEPRGAVFAVALRRAPTSEEPG